MYAHHGWSLVYYALLHKHFAALKENDGDGDGDVNDDDDDDDDNLNQNHLFRNKDKDKSCRLDEIGKCMQAFI